MQRKHGCVGCERSSSDGALPSVNKKKIENIPGRWNSDSFASSLCVYGCCGLLCFVQYRSICIMYILYCLSGVIKIIIIAVIIIIIITLSIIVPALISVQGSQMAGDNPAVGCRYFPLCPQLPRTLWTVTVTSPASQHR